MITGLKEHEVRVNRKVTVSQADNWCMLRLPRVTVGFQRRRSFRTFLAHFLKIKLSAGLVMDRAYAPPSPARSDAVLACGITPNGTRPEQQQDRPRETHFDSGGAFSSW